MKFGAVPIDEAKGAILAHSVRLPGGALKKGRVLSADDIAALAAAGRREVIAARLETSDMAEDEAAATLAAALIGDHLLTSAAFTGRCNLFAVTRGVVRVDAARVDRFNLVDEAITLATVPALAAVEARQMVATVKIIPFAAPREAVARCLAIAREAAPLLRLAPLKAKRVGLIQSRGSAVKPSVLDATVATTAARIAALGSELAETTITDHDAAAIARAIADQRARGCDPILVMGGSAIVDRRDAIPAAITAQGGTVVHFGMPVDPGNLLLLGRVGDSAVLGLPGCARSPKFNGFDWVLQRLLADLPVGRDDIMRMGVGGLLTEIPSRPLPRLNATSEQPSVMRAPRIGAVVMAAGRSSRMAPANKLLAEIDGKPMVVRAVESALASQARPVIVVVGHEGARVRAALAGKSVTIVDNPAHAEGMASSLKVALSALPDDLDGALFLLGDMPRVAPAHLDRLIAAFDPREGRAICVPVHRAKRGNPVLWAARFFAEMRAVSGDAGARVLLGEHADQICEVEMADDGVLLDIDTPEALAALGAPPHKASA